MQKKKGISLIVLVITIIVMIILAAAIVITLSNSNIINKANEAVDMTDKAQLKNIAALAWADAYTARLDGATKTLETLTIENIRKAGITEEQLPDEDIEVSNSGVILLGIDTVKHEGTIPEGAKWVKYLYDEYRELKEKIEYGPGQQYPEISYSNEGQDPCALDIYMYGDYAYVFNGIWIGEANMSYTPEDPLCEFVSGAKGNYYGGERK